MRMVFVIGTCDTKYDDLLYVKSIIRGNGLDALLVDVGARKPAGGVDVSSRSVASCHPSGGGFVDSTDDRGEFIELMSESLEYYLKRNENSISGVIGLGGSGGTSLITRGMRALPIGVPKLMVSTVASGDVAPYVGPNDITMMYSVTDVAGINRISAKVLGNAANAISGMAKFGIPSAGSSRPAIGLTMFGVTTPCVEAVKGMMEKKYDCLVFHATGTGGQSMEKLLESGMFAGVIDVTTTEVCDLLMGGVFSAGDDRLGAVIRTRCPYVGSVGALDMVNFHAMDTVPEKYRNRNLYVHNPQVTLMRTTPEENRIMGEWIARKLNQCEGEVRFLIPERGVSMIDAPGKPFYDPDADRELFDSLEKNVSQTPKRKLVRLPYHINDPEFAEALVNSFMEITK